ncbi:unnamed protein product [Adineta ricciae]|uniref:Uncharacterized protein n=1 Tax=Adineta ricciae TaxID=249248 RepID=A0A814PUC9_ADIRI|nr:unnamed protein product [Adineta ricciae]
MVGIRVQKIDLISSTFKCSQCSLILRDPVQLIGCGHRLCQSCVREQPGDSITCAECYQRFSRKDFQRDRGFQNDLNTLVVHCAYCDWTDEMKKYQKHLNEMHSNPTCEFCEEKFSSDEDFIRHQLYSCEKIFVSCPFKQFGCQDHIPLISLNKHYRTAQHQLILMNIVFRWKSLLATGLLIDFKQTEQITADELQDIAEMVNILSETIPVLKDDSQRIISEASHLQENLNAISQDCSTLKLSIQEQNSVLDTLAVSQERLQADIKSIEGMINTASSTTYDGTYIWKIDHIAAKIIDARTEKQMFICSPSFYSSVTGYKMCLRLYLNGDKDAHGTHISLFIVLMRGPYDAILEFPFLYKIIFCLYDQTKRQDHIIDSFLPDETSNSFHRPTSEMNVASGISRFASLKVVNEEDSRYTREDTMYIKAAIDFLHMHRISIHP